VSLAECTQTSWDRFQSLLESLIPGDEIHLAAASRQTGLPPTTCETVLDALSRIDLFTRVGDHTFVRRRMDDSQPQGTAESDRR
jgi:hypothetical protein